MNSMSIYWRTMWYIHQKNNEEQARSIRNNMDEPQKY